VNITDKRYHDCTDGDESSIDVFITGDLNDEVVGDLIDDGNNTSDDECVTTEPAVEWTSKVGCGAGGSDEDEISGNDIVTDDDIGNKVVDVDDDHTTDDGVGYFDGKWVVLDKPVELSLLLEVTLTLDVIFVVAKVLIAEVSILPWVLMVIWNITWNCYAQMVTYSKYKGKSVKRNHGYKK